ncbi:MAG TPA: hypothetical protein ENK10_01800, partial [Acidobacteria bacterium]|nr:hypothetical protein [Acidobacteriota bacterium]
MTSRTSLTWWAWSGPTRAPATSSAGSSGSPPSAPAPEPWPGASPEPPAPDLPQHSSQSLWSPRRPRSSRGACCLSGRECRWGCRDSPLTAIMRRLDGGWRMITPLRWTDGVLELLEQRLLPAEEKWIRCASGEEVARAISEMVVRGAPAIGVSAAFGLALDLRRAAEQGGDLAEELSRSAEMLVQARPTAVNLAWAVDRLCGVARRALADGLAAREVAHRVEEEARAMVEEDVQANRDLGRAGSLLLPDGARVLTHCNAGALATAGYGTALGVVRAAREAGKRVAVLADETRP